MLLADVNVTSVSLPIPPAGALREKWSLLLRNRRDLSGDGCSIAVIVSAAFLADPGVRGSKADGIAGVAVWYAKDDVEPGAAEAVFDRGLIE